MKSLPSISRCNLICLCLVMLVAASWMAWSGTHALSADKCVSISTGTVDCQETADNVRAWAVTVTGSARYGPTASDVWDSAIISYITPEGHINYATVRIGGPATTVRGRNLHVFVADASSGDNSGSLTVTVK